MATDTLMFFFNLAWTAATRLPIVTFSLLVLLDVDLQVDIAVNQNQQENVVGGAQNQLDDDDGGGLQNQDDDGDADVNDPIIDAQLF